MLLDPNVEPVVSVERAAQLLSISRASAYRAVQAGTLPALRFGRTVRIPTARLLGLLGLPGDGRSPVGQPHG